MSVEISCASLETGFPNQRSLKLFKIISDNSIEINGKIIKFPCSILRDHQNQPMVLQHEDRVMVVFYPRDMEESKRLNDTRICMDRNIGAFDLQGNFVWVVAPPIITPYPRNPYTSLYLVEGKVRAANWCGYDFEIDTQNGTVQWAEDQGRPW